MTGLQETSLQATRSSPPPFPLPCKSTAGLSATASTLKILLATKSRCHTPTMNNPTSLTLFTTECHPGPRPNNPARQQPRPFRPKSWAISNPSITSLQIRRMSQTVSIPMAPMGFGCGEPWSTKIVFMITFSFTTGVRLRLCQRQKQVAL